VEVTAAQRSHLSEARLDIDDALAATRPERVAAMTRAEHVPEYVTEVLGPFPETRGGQRTWCALAVEVEEERDVRCDQAIQRPVPLVALPAAFTVGGRSGAS